MKKYQIIDLLIEGLPKIKDLKNRDSEGVAYWSGFNRNKDQTIKYLKGLKG